MNFTIEELKVLINTFKRIEKEIKEEITPDKNKKLQQKESEIVIAYNKIIQYSYPIWQSPDKKLKENIKSILVDIHKRLSGGLSLLNSNVELPDYLTSKIKLREMNDERNEAKKEDQLNTEGVLEKLLTTTGNSNKMTELNELRAQIEKMRLMLQTSEERQQKSERQNAEFYRNNPVQTMAQYDDISTQITSGDQIQLESYRSIPEFSGNKGQYRSWRNQVTRRMRMINDFKEHPKYEAALGIVRAKITGHASDVITNNKTAYNIEAIIQQLDSSYSDQRPLYVIEAEMLSITQSNKTLQEFYDEINQGLNMIISKIVMKYGTLSEQQPLIAESQQKAIRTFIVGLRSQAIRNILYSHKPKTLPDAFTTAQTVYFDTQYLNLDQHREAQKRELQKNQPRQHRQQGFSGKFYSEMKPTRNYSQGFNVNMNCNQPAQQMTQPHNKYEQKETNTSNRANQDMNWRQPNAPQRRENNFQRQNVQHPQKFGRINQIQDTESNPNEGYENDICDDIPDDLISNCSHTSNETKISSAFLDG